MRKFLVRQEHLPQTFQKNWWMSGLQVKSKAGQKSTAACQKSMKKSMEMIILIGQVAPHAFYPVLPHHGQGGRTRSPPSRRRSDKAQGVTNSLQGRPRRCSCGQIFKVEPVVCGSCCRGSRRWCDQDQVGRWGQGNLISRASCWDSARRIYDVRGRLASCWSVTLVRPLADGLSQGACRRPAVISYRVC